MLIKACFATDKRTCVFDRIFGQVPSTHSCAYEHFRVSKICHEYECSKNDNRVRVPSTLALLSAELRKLGVFPLRLLCEYLGL